MEGHSYEICQKWHFVPCSGTNKMYRIVGCNLVTTVSTVSIASLVNSLKGVSSRRLRQRFEVFKKVYLGDKVALWSRSYFAASVGGAPIEVLKQYIEQQNTPY